MEILSNIDPTVLKFVILGVVLIVAGAFFVLYPSDKTRKSSKKFVEGLANSIYTIIVANLNYRVFESDEVCTSQFEIFKNQVLKDIYEDAWDFVKVCIDDAVSNKKLDPLARLVIRKKTVDSLVDVIVSRKDVKDLFEEAYAQLTNETYRAMMEEERKAKEEAEWAESQPLEEGDPVSEDTVSLFDEPEPTEEQLNSISEPISEEEHDVG